MIKKFKIEKNIPVPIKAKNIEAKYPFMEMEVGDSFFVPNMRKESLSTTICKWRKRRKIKFQFLTAKERNGVRVWKIG
jgi:hypothetical protein